MATHPDVLQHCLQEAAKPFGMALATLEYAWDEQDQQALQKRRNVVLALRFAEDRQERADQIAFELGARPDLDKVPGVMLDFLFGPWSLAMAHARLVDERNQIDPEGFGSVVPDLLWSVKRDVTLKRPDKLINMIPGLLAKMHSGLAMLSSLRTGDWVDLHSKRRWLRAQLVWASTKGNLFMFLSHGGQPHSMTKRSCEKLIMQRWLRPVDTHGVVAQALHVMAVEVAQTLATGQPVPQTAQDQQNEPETV